MNLRPRSPTTPDATVLLAAPAGSPPGQPAGGPVTGSLVRGSTLGLALGAGWGVVARVWMRLISTDPVFSWSGTLIIVGLAALLGACVGLVNAALRAGRSGWWRLAVLPGLVLLLGPGMLLAPSFLVGGLAWRPHAWWLRTVGALVLVGSVAGSTWLVTSDPEPGQPVTAADVMVFLTGFAVLAFALAWASSLVWQQKARPASLRARDDANRTWRRTTVLKATTPE